MESDPLVLLCSPSSFNCILPITLTFKLRFGPDDTPFAVKEICSVLHDFYEKYEKLCQVLCYNPARRGKREATHKQPDGIGLQLKCI